MFCPSKCSNKKSPIWEKRFSIELFIGQKEQKKHYLNSSNQSLNFLWCTVTETSLNYCLSCCWHHDDDGRIDYCHSGQSSQNNKPEPQENINLFIQYVQGEHTESVVFLYGTRGTILVECAFCNAREYLKKQKINQMKSMSN